MELHLTLSEACELAKKDDPTLIKSADTLLGAALILVPLTVLGPGSPSLLPALGILGVKNELTKIGRRLFSKIAGKQEKDALSQQKRMEAAYVIVCYSAFFEAVDSIVRDVKPILRMKRSASLDFSDTFVKQLKSKMQHKSADETIIRNDLDHISVPFPHPVDDFDHQVEKLSQVYEQLSKGLLNLIKETRSWAETDSEAQKQIATMCQRLPERACKNFKPKYFKLAARYHEFFIWSSLNEHMRTRSRIGRLIGKFQQLVELMESAKTQLDVGFKQLSQAIESLPSILESEQSNRIMSRLKVYYKDRIDRPVIEEIGPDTTGDEPALECPKSSEAFIPQSFRVIRYSGKEHLEEEATWQNAGEPRNDIGPFIFSYLSSPYGDDKPLLVLGHPGSGKSLLTKVLCVSLFSRRWSPIRVVLRDVAADHDVIDQIEQQIRWDTQDSSARWVNLQEQFRSCPPVVMLDGYDELLQATGKTYANYLIKVGQFQRQNGMFLQTPVRAIVTSRLTLMDKADIEPGTTVIRLEPFDEVRRQKWIDIWNRLNNDYFQSHHLNAFAIPKGDTDNERRIRELAEQPLLLLMIALYDSIDNGVKNVKEFDRTVLYDRLLRAFIFRELFKKTERQEGGQEEAPEEVDTNIQRLGVAAMGMFARRSLSILKSQLESDLDVFGLREQPSALSTGRPLTPAEKLLGSFFFIVMSKASYGIQGVSDREADASFEFMHNTFGEFLTADFILRKILVETESIHALRHNRSLHALLNRGLQSLDGLPDDWYACLMHAPLHTRPIILDMMREWLKHRLRLLERDYSDFIEDFGLLVARQVEQILVATGTGLSTIFARKRTPTFPPVPALAQLAIYSLNLLVLRAALSEGPFTIDEESMGSLLCGVRPWDQLTHLWRACFSTQDLNKLSATLYAERKGTKIVLMSKGTVQSYSSDIGLGMHLNVARALADNASAALMGLVANSVAQAYEVSWDEIEERLHSEGIDLGGAIEWYKFQQSLRAAPNERKRREVCRKFMNSLSEAGGHISGLVGPLVKEYAPERHLELVADALVLPEDSSHESELSPALAVELIRLADRLGDVKSLRGIYEKAASFGPGTWGDISLELAAELTRIAQKFGGGQVAMHVFGPIAANPDTIKWLDLPRDFIVDCIRFFLRASGDEVLENVYHAAVSQRAIHEWFRVSPAVGIQLLRLELRLHKPDGHDKICELLSSYLTPSLWETLSPDVAIDLADLLLLVGDTQHAALAYDMLTRDVHCLDWMEMSDSGIIQLISLARRCGDTGLLKGIHDRFSKVLSPLNRVDVRWELSIKLLYLACVFARGDDFHKILTALCKRETPIDCLEEEPALIGELLRLQKNNGNLSSAAKLAALIRERDVGRLPIKYLFALTWLADVANDDELLFKLRREARSYRTSILDADPHDDLSSNQQPPTEPVV